MRADRPWLLERFRLKLDGVGEREGGKPRNDEGTPCTRLRASERLSSMRSEAPGWRALSRRRDAERALPHARWAKHRAADGRGISAVAQVQLEARVLLRRGQESAARCTPAGSPASPIDRGRERGRPSRP